MSLEINAAVLPPLGSAGVVYDPQDAQWGKEGDEIRTHSGRLSSLAESTIELVWEALDEDQASSILDYWFDVVVPAGGLVTSIKIPPKVAVDTGGLGTWKVYSGVDGDPIEADDPQFSYAGPYYRTVRWRFRRVCHALER